MKSMGKDNSIEEVPSLEFYKNGIAKLALTKSLGFMKLNQLSKQLHLFKLLTADEPKLSQPPNILPWSNCLENVGFKEEEGLSGLVRCLRNAFVRELLENSSKYQPFFVDDVIWIITMLKLKKNFCRMIFLLEHFKHQ